MWKRLRRRSLAPSRPVIFPEQLGLVLLCAAAIVFGLFLSFRLLLG